jgi:diaminohydroxyphosphoribosylaminopyrimidine deaminase/5-amino-6-(5-phosphoribosylamino)uracil reductase
MTDSKRSAHEGFMRRALELAREGWGQTAPNPMVGAVVVRDDRIVGEGFHAKYGGEHAEVAALRKAGAACRGATLYVTLEPCRHHGKTPPCTDAIFSCGISKVVYAVGDPTPVAGGGAAELREAAMMEVESGVLAAEAKELNAAFFHSQQSDLPWTTLKLAVSMEMAIANERGSTTWLTSPESRAEVHRMRAGHDAVGVGVGTIIADDPHLNVRDAPKPRKAPARVIFDRTLRTPLQSKVVFTARETPTIVLTSTTAPPKKADALRDSGVHVLAASDLRDGFRRLRGAGIQSILVEGGATIANAVVDEGLAHRLVIFQAPVSLGPEALHAFDGANSRLVGRLELLRVLERREIGPDTLTTYVLQEW